MGMPYLPSILQIKFAWGVMCNFGRNYPIVLAKECFPVAWMISNTHLFVSVHSLTVV